MVNRRHANESQKKTCKHDVVVMKYCRIVQFSPRVRMSAHVSRKVVNAKFSTTKEISLLEPAVFDGGGVIRLSLSNQESL